ncbi:MAG: TIGR03085 family metal-binding protein [Jatrophihabitantaceae bacterium]
MPHHALDERRELCATLRTVGPGVATLCGDWTTSELTAHMVLRERSVVELAGRLPFARFQQRAERAISAFVSRHPYPELVDLLDAGPPAFSPWALPPLREAVNLLEYLIHHEDVRRAAGKVSPRALSVARQRAAWQRLRLAAPMTMRAIPLGVRLVWPSHGEICTRRVQPVTVTGDPVELALVAFGRQRVAQVSYEGSPADVALVSGARIAI